MNERIVQIIVKNDLVMGLTSMGHLARFDVNLGVWITQGKPEVYNSNHELVTNHVTVNEPISARKMALAASQLPPPEVVHKQTDYVFIYILMAMACTAGLILIGLLKYFHVF